MKNNKLDRASKITMLMQFIDVDTFFSEQTFENISKRTSEVRGILEE